MRLAPALAAAFVLVTAAVGAAPSAPPLPPVTQTTVVRLAPHALRSMLPGTTVRAVAQTRDGYLWLAQRNGLLRFDGVAFTGGPEDEAGRMAALHARQLLATKDGRLYAALAGTDNGLLDDRAGVLTGGAAGLVVIDGGRAQRLRAMDAERVWALAEVDGDVWAGTERGLARLQGQGEEGAPSWIMQGRHVTSLAVVGHGVLAGARDGLFLVDGKGVRPLSAEGPVTALAVTADGARAWVATGRQIHSVDLRDRNARPVPLPVWLPHVTALLADRAGVLWAGTVAGLIRLRADGPESYGHRDGLSDEKILALAQDAEGSVWVGTRAGGVTQIQPAHLWNVGGAEGLEGDTAFAVLAGRDGSVWMTSTGGVSRWRDGLLTTYRYGPGLPWGNLRSMAEAHDGRIWFSAGDAGLVRFADGLFTALPLPAPVKGVVADRDGQIWVSFTRGGVARIDPARGNPVVTSFGMQEGVCAGELGSLAARRQGGIWAAGYNGIARVGGADDTSVGAARCLTTSDGLPENRISFVAEDRLGALWAVGHSHEGLIRITPGGVKQMISNTAGIDVNIYGLVEDAAGDLWTPTGQGILRLRRSDLDAHLAGLKTRIPTRRFAVADGLRSDEATLGFGPPSVRAKDGRMWFVTLLGLAVIAPPTDAQLPPLVRPLVESLIADGERRSPATARPLALPAGTKTIAVEFTAPTFLAPSALQFEYKLSGVDEKWRTTGHRRSIQFGHLPPGAYDFAVRLGRPHGDPAHETSVAFTIAPHFFRTTMFLLTVGALVLVLVLVGHRLRIRQVAGRFRAIQTERGRIARDLHDGLAQSFTAIGYHLDALAATNKGVPETQALVEQTRTIVDHSHAQMRRSIWDLRAEGQEAGTFVERLAALTAELRSAHTSITVRCGDLPALSTLVQHEALLVAREAVTNALRHAKAAHIAVAARWEEAGFHLVVEDDGGGFGTPGARPPDHSHGGFGIIGMKERAARLDGTLSIAAGTQGGTAVTLFVPAAAARTDEERS